MSTIDPRPTAHDPLQLVDELLQRRARSRWGPQARVSISGAVRGRLLTGHCEVVAGHTPVWAGTLEEALRLAGPEPGR